MPESSAQAGPKTRGSCNVTMQNENAQAAKLHVRPVPRESPLVTEAATSLAPLVAEAATSLARARRPRESFLVPSAVNGAR